MTILSVLSIFFAFIVFQTLHLSGEESNEYLHPGEHALDFELHGFKRNAIVYIPNAVTRQKLLPVVLFIHGAGGNANHTSKNYGWEQKAESEGFIAVFPEALPLHPEKPAEFKTNPRLWEDGSNRFPNRHDDMAYFEMLLQELSSKAPVDPKRIFSTGFSNGASMTFRLGIEMSDVFAAIAPVSGHLWIKHPHPKRAMSLMFIVGADDPLNPLNGGEASNPWTMHKNYRQPMFESVKEWLKVIQATELQSTEKVEGNVITIHYGPGKTGAELFFIIIKGQGHEWPGAQRALPLSITGPSIKSIDATDVIWRFFKHHPSS